MSCHSISDILFLASGATPKLTTERLTCVRPLRSLEASWLMVLNNHCKSRRTLRRSAACVIRLLLADSRFFPDRYPSGDPAVTAAFCRAPPLSPACCGPASRCAADRLRQRDYSSAPSAANVTVLRVSSGLSLCSLSRAFCPMPSYRVPSSSSGSHSVVRPSLTLSGAPSANG